jgi:AhpD family alkylhydroperoxidase
MVMTIDNRIKELIAVGASITANCQPCLQYHAEKAFEYGADAGEIAAAIEVGKQVRKGASGKMDAYASHVLLAGPAQDRKPESACCG